MNRFFTSLALLVATLVPAQAGLFQWGNDDPTNLSGVSARFVNATSDNALGTNVNQFDIVCGIFDFGNINGRDVFGLMKAMVLTTGTTTTFSAPINGGDRLSTLLGGTGAEFESQYASLATHDSNPDALFALFSSSDSQDFSTVLDPNDPLLGINSTDFRLDMTAGIDTTADTLAIVSNEFLMGLSVAKTNGVIGGFEQIAYGSSGNTSELVTTSPLSTVTDWTTNSDYAFEIASGANLQFNAVPEPTSLAILGLVGVAGTAMRRRRK